MRNKDVKEKELQLYASEIKTTYLRSVIAEKIMQNMTKSDIIDWLMDEYKMQFKAAMSAWRQGYVYLWLYSEHTKDEVKQLSLSRLEELYHKAEHDGLLVGKDFYATQFKNIDLTNKTAGVYDQDEDKAEKSGDINFNVNFGNMSEDATIDYEEETNNEDE